MTLKLQLKLMLGFLLVSLASLALMGGMGYRAAQDALERSTQIVKENLQAVAHGREAAVAYYLRDQLGLVALLATDKSVREGAERLGGDKPGGVAEIAALGAYLTSRLKAIDGDAYEIMVLSAAGRVVASTDAATVGVDKSSDAYYLTGREGRSIKDVYRSRSTDKAGFAASAPIHSTAGNRLVGVLVVRFTLDTLNAITTNREGLGDSGEVYLVNKAGVMLSESRFIADAILRQRVETPPVRQFQEKGGHHIEVSDYRDYRGHVVVGASANDMLPELGGVEWLMLVEMEADEVYQSASQLRNSMLLLAVSLTLLFAFIGYFVARGISRPFASIIGLLASTSAQLGTTTDEHERNARRQAGAVNETGSSVEELNATARQSTEQAEVALNAAQQALAMADEGRAIIDKTLGGMRDIRAKSNTIGEQILLLGEQSAQIGSITRLVSDVAAQTNLLALNASVEAAHAGEHGKGFSVVATEIRKLADQSKKSAERIHELVEEIQKASNTTIMASEQGSKAIDEGSEEAERAASAFRAIVEAVGSSYENMQQITLNSKQQSDAVRQVVEAMNSISAGAKETAAGIAQTREVSKSMSDIASRLQQQI